MVKLSTRMDTREEKETGTESANGKRIRLRKINIHTDKLVARLCSFLMGSVQCHATTKLIK